MTIPDEAVQAAARALCRFGTSFSTIEATNSWVDEKWTRYKEEAALAITAAAPFLQGVKVKERVFVVTALAQTSEKTGWRSRIVGAANIDEAIGRGLRAFEAGEQCANFCVPGAIEISAETLATAGILSAIEASALEPSPRAQALEEGISHAVAMISEQLEKHHDFEGDTPQSSALRDISHHLQGTLIASAETALSSQPVEDGWLPIETAPIGNGSNRFLAYITGHGPCVCYRNANGTVLSVDGRTILRATHWRPLPASPGASE